MEKKKSFRFRPAARQAEPTTGLPGPCRPIHRLPPGRSRTSPAHMRRLARSPPACPVASPVNRLFPPGGISASQPICLTSISPSWATWPAPACSAPPELGLCAACPPFPQPGRLPGLSGDWAGRPAGPPAGLLFPEPFSARFSVFFLQRLYLFPGNKRGLLPHCFSTSRARNYTPLLTKKKLDFSLSLL